MARKAAKSESDNTPDKSGRAPEEGLEAVEGGGQPQAGPGQQPDAGKMDDVAGPATTQPGQAAEPGGPPEVYNCFQDACRAYQEKLQSLWTGDDSQQQAQAAYENYLHAMQKGMALEDAQQRFKDEEHKFLSALHSIYARENLRQGFGEAYYDYMRAIRLCWTEHDPTTIHPAELAAISQSIAVAGNLATLSLEILRQRELAALYYQGLLSSSSPAQ